MKAKRNLIQICLPCALMLSAVVQAQDYIYTTNNDGTLTITGYIGSGGAVFIPGTINDLPVTSIGDWTFYSTDVTNVTIPDSVTTIGDGAFFDCESLTNVTIGDSVTDIGNWTFAFCSSLTSVNFRGDAPSLGGADVFYGNLATVYYLLGTTNWGPTFDGHPAVLWNPPLPYNYETNNDAITITGYTGSDGTVIIPSTINFLPVTSIADFAFYNCTSLTIVAIPNNVTNIGEDAFYDCANLSSVTIPNSVNFIGAFTFMSCFNLTNVIIPDSIAYIGGGAFEQCFSLKSVTIPDSVNNIGNYAFWDCSSLTSVTIGTNVITIQADAFADCGNLTSITIPNSVINLQTEAFFGCGSLTNVIIGWGVTSIGQNQFLACGSLTTITVDPLNSVYSSVAGVLFNKSQTTLIECPDGKSGDYTIPNSVTNIADSAFSSCSSLKSITIPNSVTSIGIESFSDCTGLTNVTIGTGVTSIGNGAFYYCPSLNSITIPSSVTSIGGYVFYSCPSLNWVYFQGNAPSVGGPYVFLQDNNVMVYYLPGTTGWSGFHTDPDVPTALWTPQIQTSNASFGVLTNQFGFNINWASGQTVVVEGCTNLTNPIWLPIATNTLASGTFYFSDPQWTNYPGRFYRVHSP
jgi:hypothetical protein